MVPPAPVTFSMERLHDHRTRIILLFSLEPLFQKAQCRGLLWVYPQRNQMNERALKVRMLYWRRAVLSLRGVLPILTILVATSLAAQGEDLACLSTTFRLLGANDKVCISVFDDPKVPGVACHVSQARTGGIKGSLGLAEDPSRFSVACRQDAPITIDIATLPAQEEVYSERTSVFFKHTHVFRILDKKRNTLVYVALSDKIVEGSPQNSISTVPVMPWAH
jgi:CreA protein